jgi:hypothetical protein
MDFTEPALRHCCRNPKCRSKLPVPVSNEREAFCARGCHSAFYRTRCRVCEAPIKQPSRGGQTFVCKKSKCINAWRVNSGFARYHHSLSVVSTSETPIKSRVKSCLKDDPGIAWAIAVNRARIVAPRRVLDAVFGHVPLMQPQPERLAA